MPWSVGATVAVVPWSVGCVVAVVCAAACCVTVMVTVAVEVSVEVMVIAADNMSDSLPLNPSWPRRHLPLPDAVTVAAVELLLEW